MIMIKILIPAAILLGLTACTTTTPTTWTQQGVTIEQGNSDLAACKFEVGKQEIKGEQANKLINQCMQSKGYQQKTTPAQE